MRKLSGEEKSMIQARLAMAVVGAGILLAAVSAASTGPVAATQEMTQ